MFYIFSSSLKQTVSMFMNFVFSYARTQKNEFGSTVSSAIAVHLKSRVAANSLLCSPTNACILSDGATKNSELTVQ